MIGKLKYITFNFDEKTKELSIIRLSDKIEYAVPKRYTLPLLTFLVRVVKKGLHLKRK